MKKRTLGVMALVGVAVLAASAQGVVIEKFEAEFTAFSGQDATAVSPVTSSTGSPVAGDFTVTFMDVGLVPAGWLTQGSIGGTPTTAKFTNPPGSGTRGRARFSAPLPTSMKGNDGVQVEWSARYGNYAMLRAPIQIAITDTGEPQGPGVLAFNAYLRVQNGTTLAIQSNSGSLYSTINALTIPNVADGQYHQWTTQILVRDGMAYWDLRLDGTQLLFGGTDGSPVLEGRQYSFRTGPNSFTGNPYIGLGELQSGAANGWDFEFDYVRFQNLPEPATLILLGVGACGLIRRRRQSL